MVVAVESRNFSELKARGDHVRQETAALTAELAVNIMRGEEIVKRIVLDDPRARFVAAFEAQGAPFGLHAEAA
jgi:hypothetical protein